jgi:hypothetical protein
MTVRGKLFAAVAAGAVLALGVNAAAATGLLAGHWPGPKAPGTGAPPPKVATAAAIGDGTNEDTYTPVTPCRIVDTRPVGPILKGTVRSFMVRGNAGFPAQGGHSGGCNIPADAVAVSMTLTSLQASATGGLLRAYATGTPKPATAFASADKGLRLSSGGSVGLCMPVASCVGGDLTVAADLASANVLLDVTGYYRSPIYAEVRFDGVLLNHSNRVLSVTKVGTGIYVVDTDRDVSTCSYAATSSDSGLTATAAPRSGDADGVTVLVQGGGLAVDATFYLTVTC